MNAEGTDLSGKAGKSSNEKFGSFGGNEPVLS